MEDFNNTQETTEETKSTEVDAQTEKVDKDTTVESDKIVDKLQKRLGKEQAEKKEAKTRLEEALSRIEELEKGNKKSLKDKSDEEKQSELQKAKDEEIAQLRSQIKLAEISQQADEVLKESGIAVGKEVLSMLVNEDIDKTLTNVKALINLLSEQQKSWETKRNTGITPKKTPENNSDPFQEILNKYK